MHLWWEVDVIVVCALSLTKMRVLLPALACTTCAPTTFYRKVSYFVATQVDDAG